jgi:predicted transglutaminase-like cysteine proteinase
MKNLLLIIFLTTTLLFSSTLEDLKITDDDFIKISHSSQKNNIFERINDLIQLKKSLSDVDDDFIKLNEVNDFYNTYPYISDETIYNKKDYWATRKEFIIKGAGDCEDFVIAKYFTLIEVGVDESKLSVIHNLHNNEYHLVLGYQEEPHSELFILDSINKEILPLTKREDILVLHTLETIDLNNKEIDILSDIKNLSNYKWTKIYLSSKNKKIKLIN